MGVDIILFVMYQKVQWEKVTVNSTAGECLWI